MALRAAGTLTVGRSQNTYLHASLRHLKIFTSKLNDKAIKWLSLGGGASSGVAGGAMVDTLVRSWSWVKTRMCWSSTHSGEAGSYSGSSCFGAQQDQRKGSTRTVSLSSSYNYRTDKTPVVTGISRSNGTTAGGTTVLLFGYNLGSSDTTGTTNVSVTLGGVLCATRREDVSSYRGKSLCDWKGVSCDNLGLSTATTTTGNGVLQTITCLTNPWMKGGRPSGPDSDSPTEAAALRLRNPEVEVVVGGGGEGGGTSGERGPTASLGSAKVDPSVRWA